MKIRISQLTIGLILVITTLVSANLNWGKDRWKGIVEADGKGYYAYLPAVFIYHDLNFGFFDHIEKEKYYAENLYYDYRSGANGKTINKYYVGTAVAELPFFLLAHAYTIVTSGELDGYAKPYAISVNLAALFYLFLGLIFLNRLLKTYDLSETTRAFTLLATVFGTNLFYYVIGEPGMSHIYSFGIISTFLYLTRSFFFLPAPKKGILAGLLLGLIVLIRPLNGLILLAIPFLASDFETLKLGLLTFIRQKWTLLLSIICFALMVVIQPVIYKLSTGNFWVYSYGEEGFNFLNPQFYNILFSYKKGLFLYTPIFLLSLFGLYYVWKQSIYLFFSWFLFFLLITYIFASWWMWYYGGSFSSRVYVEYLPLFMILFGMTIQHLSTKLTKGLYIGLASLLILLCQVQTYQYRYYQIHWSDMTQEKYWSVFLRLDQIGKTNP